MSTPVIFRKFKDNNSIVALFPTLPGTRDPYTCDSYMHIGQHGTASPDIIYTTSLATLEEYGDLLSELKSIGYDDLIIRKKFTYAYYLKRETALIRSG
jgi:hypothetical protein